MNLFTLLTGRSSAPVARERLQILLAHERPLVTGTPDLLSIVREEIIAVLAKHVPLDPDRVQVSMDRGETASTLEIEIEIPTAVPSGRRTPVDFPSERTTSR
jgi:cell division topological specificity factor